MYIVEMSGIFRTELMLRSSVACCLFVLIEC